MEHNGISKLDVKRRNRMQILKYIRYCGPQSRIDISIKLKLTRAAVTIITTEMINQGIIYEKGEENTENKKNTRGRRKIFLDISRNYKFVFGVAIEKDILVVGLTNLFGEILDKSVIQISNLTYIQLLELITERINKISRDNCLIDEKILGIGVCLSNSGCQYVEEKSQTAKIKKIRKDLAHAFMIPVTSARTIDGAALAQFTFDSDMSDDEKCAVIIRFGNEIDSTVTIGNTLYCGITNNSGGIKKLQNGTNAVSSFERILAEIKRAYSLDNTPYLYQATNADVSAVIKLPIDYEQCKKDFIVKNILDNLNNKLANDIYMIATVLDSEDVFVFGDYLDCNSNIQQLNAIMSNMYSPKFEIKKCIIDEHNLFLCGCAIAVQDFFVNKGGFDF